MDLPFLEDSKEEILFVEVLMMELLDRMELLKRWDFR